MLNFFFFFFFFFFSTLCYLVLSLLLEKKKKTQFGLLLTKKLDFAELLTSEYALGRGMLEENFQMMTWTSMTGLILMILLTSTCLGKCFPAPRPIPNSAYP
jgi:hypothetical protein